MSVKDRFKQPNYKLAGVDPPAEWAWFWSAAIGCAVGMHEVITPAAPSTNGTITESAVAWGRAVTVPNTVNSYVAFPLPTFDLNDPWSLVWYGIPVGTTNIDFYCGLGLLNDIEGVGIGSDSASPTEWKIISRASIVVVVSLFCLGITSDVPSLMVILFPLAISGGVMNTVINSLISKSVERSQVGSALGLATSMESLSWIIAPIIGGLLIDFYGGLTFAIVSGVIASLMIPYLGLILKKVEIGKKSR